MNSRIIIGIACFLIAVSGTAVANMLLLVMTGTINSNVAPDKRISYFGWTLRKTIDVYREYRRVDPNGRLHIVSLLAVGVAAIAIAGAGVCFGIIPVLGPVYGHR